MFRVCCHPCLHQERGNLLTGRQITQTTICQMPIQSGRREYTTVYELSCTACQPPKRARDYQEAFLEHKECSHLLTCSLLIIKRCVWHQLCSSILHVHYAAVRYSASPPPLLFSFLFFFSFRFTFVVYPRDRLLNCDQGEGCSPIQRFVPLLTGTFVQVNRVEFDALRLWRIRRWAPPPDYMIRETRHQVSPSPFTRSRKPP